MDANEVIEAALPCETIDGPPTSFLFAEIDGEPRRVTYYTLVNGHEIEPGAPYPRPLPTNAVEAIALLCGKLLEEVEDHPGSVLVWRIRPYTKYQEPIPACDSEGQVLVDGVAIEGGWIARCRLAFVPDGAKVRMKVSEAWSESTVLYGTPGL